MPGIINFIKICNQYNVGYHIAGAFDGANKIVSKLIKEGLNENVFIGYIDTIPFLEEHADEYLFVAGVGQAIMEAASLGYPALVTAFTKNYHHSSFITPANIKYLRSDNFVIRDTPCFQSNVSAFFENVCSGIVSQQFNVAQNMYELCDINSILPEYLAILKEASIKRKSVTGEVI
ncbi:glycosyltransferase family 4 protein [Salmonella enterica subsp. enterica serovar Stanley]|nr:glycosyltransferase family 4 protein [Salmonella enterica subsp. enterica serovar Stanley]